MRILLTGGAGFIGHHVAEHLLKNTDYQITFLDRLDSSGNMNRIAQTRDWDKHKKRCRFVFHDLKAAINTQLASQIGGHDVIVHMAASTHVDRSITDPMSFVMDNVVGTTNLLMHAVDVGCDKFFNFGTDEVFGSAPDDVWFKEWDRYKSSNPYAASKAGAEEMGVAFHNTYRVPVITTHTMNVFGERQHPEKFIPSVIDKVSCGATVLVHADRTRTRAGSRHYLHARNLAAALLFLIEHGVPGEKYNIVGESEVNNLQLALKIAHIMDQPLRYELVDFHSSRPGHDLRYALDGSKLADMGFSYPKSFDESLRRTVEWYLQNAEWRAAA